MPSVNVRFTDEQHDVLRRAAFDRGRGWSLQKEIIERLFGNGLAAGDKPVRQQVSPIGGSGEPGAAEMSPPEDSVSAGRSPAATPSRGFKRPGPDFKKAK